MSPTDSFLLALSIAAAPATVAAAASPPTQDAPAITTASLEEALRELGDRLDLDDGTRAEARQLYQRALDELGQARLWTQRADEHDRLAAEAPGLIAVIREELAAAPTAPRPQVAPDATVRQAELTMEGAAAEAESARRAVEELRQEAATRSGRRAALPAEIDAARGRAGEASDQLRSLVAQAGEPVPEARRALLSAQVLASEAEARALEREQASYDARAELLPARRDRAQRRLADAQRLAEAWRAVVNDLRRADAQRATERARDLRAQVAGGHEALRAGAAKVEELARERGGPEGLAARIEAVTGELDQAVRQLASLRGRSQRVRARLSGAGLTTAMGLLLRQEYSTLRADRSERRRPSARASEVYDAQYRLMALQEEREAVGDVEQRVQAFLGALDLPSDSEELRAYESVAREIFTAERDALATSIDEYGIYVDRLGRLEETARELATETRVFREQIEEHILWVRSVAGGDPPDPVAAGQAAGWLLDPRTWADGLRPAAARAARSWGRTALLALLVLAAFLAERLGRARIRALAPRVVRYTTDSSAHTWKAAGWTLVCAAAWPALCWALGRILLPVPQELPQALAPALDELARLLLLFELARRVLRPSGLAEAHFRWPGESVRALRGNLRWFTPTALVCAGVVLLMQNQPDERWNDSLGRAVFLVAMIAQALFLFRLLRPDGAILGPYVGANDDSLIVRLRHLWLVLGVVIPLALGVLALRGYYYAATQLESRLLYALAFLFGVLLVHALLMRWLFTARRRLAVEQARQKRAAERAAKADGASETGSEAEEQVDIPAVDAQTKAVFRVAVGVTVLVGLYFLFASLLPALRILERAQVWPRFELLAVEVPGLAAPPSPVGAAAAGAGGPVSAAGAEVPPLVGPLAAPRDSMAQGAAPRTEGAHVSLADVLAALILIVLTAIAVRNVPGLLEMALLQRLPLDAGARYAAKAIARYAIVVVGVSAAFAAIGVGWAKVQWLAAALTFGLAFGLQEIFANFVSGLIILFERPIRLDDLVTIGGVEGKVTRIRMRATTIMDWDRRELIVPNKEFITGQLINWTLSDPITRVTISVGVAYGSDTRKTRELLLESARRSEWVLKEPEASAIFREFGDSSLVFQLRMFTATRDNYLKLINDVMTRIDDRFREAGIEIAFPQMDLHLRSARAALRVETAPADPRDEGDPRA